MKKYFVTSLINGGILGDELLAVAREHGIDAPSAPFSGKRSVLKKDAVMLAADIVRKRS